MLAGIHEIPLFGPSAMQLLGHLAPCLACMDTVGLVEWNNAAERLFGFAQRDVSERNMFWMLFADDRLNSRTMQWAVQTPQVLASFRRDFAQAPEDESMVARVETLEQISSSFRTLWHPHDVHGRCEGRRSFLIDGLGPVMFDYSSFLVDEKKHLRLVFYVAVENQPSPPIVGERVEAAVF